MDYKCLLLSTFFGLLVADSTDTKGKTNNETDNAPLEFPTDNSKYQILNVTGKPRKVTAVEVDDLLHGGLFSNISHHNYTETSLVINVIEEKNKEESTDIKWETELIEDGTNTEDKRVKYYVQNTEEILVDHQLPLVLAISAVIIAIIGSVAYFSWRKLEYRCRQRELLINGMDPDDMRHFSI